MITYGEPPRYVRFRVDGFNPHTNRVLPSFFRPEFPHALWVQFPEFGVCEAGKPLYLVAPNSCWEGRLDAGGGDAQRTQLEIEYCNSPTTNVKVCGCQGEILEGDE